MIKIAEGINKNGSVYQWSPVEVWRMNNIRNEVAKVNELTGRGQHLRLYVEANGLVRRAMKALNRIPTIYYMLKQYHGPYVENFQLDKQGNQVFGYTNSQSNAFKMDDRSTFDTVLLKNQSLCVVQISISLNSNKQEI